MPDTIVYGQDYKHEKFLEKNSNKYVSIRDHVRTQTVRQHLYQKIATPEGLLYNLRTSYKKDM